jgi:hypothetical protein
VVAKGFQEIRVPIKSDVSAQDTRTNQVYAYNVRQKIKLILLYLIEEVNNDLYQKQKYNENCKIKFAQSLVKGTRDKLAND